MLLIATMAVEQMANYETVIFVYDICEKERDAGMRERQCSALPVGIGR